MSQRWGGWYSSRSDDLFLKRSVDFRFPKAFSSLLSASASGDVESGEGVLEQASMAWATSCGSMNAWDCP